MAPGRRVEGPSRVGFIHMKRICTISVVAALALASAATAQPGKKNAEELPVPPTTSKLEAPGIIVPYMLAFVLIGAIVGITAIPTKRGHQD